MMPFLSCRQLANNKPTGFTPRPDVRAFKRQKSFLKKVSLELCPARKTLLFFLMRMEKEEKEKPLLIITTKEVLLINSQL